MDSTPPRPDPTIDATQTQRNESPALPPEAIALAGKFFDAARHGQMEIFEQGLPAGLPPNLTNDKGDSLVSSAAGVRVLSWFETDPRLY